MRAVGIILVMGREELTTTDGNGRATSRLMQLVDQIEQDVSLGGF